MTTPAQQGRQAARYEGVVPIIKDNNPEAVFVWMIALNKIGLLWHMDDDPRQCNFPPHIAQVLFREYKEAWKICNGCADIHLLALCALGMNEPAAHEQLIKDVATVLSSSQTHIRKLLEA